MTDERIEASEGRTLFGGDARNYDESRPPYPVAVFDFLASRGALCAGTATVEIGPGTGLATRSLLARGATPVVAVEPDPRFAPFLASLRTELPAEVRIVESSFEDAVLSSESFDLVAAATSFHWVDPSIGLAKVADVLRPGGHAALWWNVFGDPEEDDAFHEATEAFLRVLPRPPSDLAPRRPFALDVRARLDDFARVGRFERAELALHRWTLVLDAERVRALYATYSPINRLPDDVRTEILDRLADVAEREFAGRVERRMVTPLYLARRT